MAIQVEGLGHVSLLKFVTTRAAFARPAPGDQPRYPASTLVCSPPTPLRRRPGLRFPSPSAYPGANAFLNRPGVRSLTPGAPEALWCGFSAAPLYPWTVRGLPGYWAVLLHACRGQTPRLGDVASPTMRWRSLLPSGSRNPLGFPG